jgi:hypothetical protein
VMSTFEPSALRTMPCNSIVGLYSFPRPHLVAIRVQSSHHRRTCGLPRLRSHRLRAFAGICCTARRSCQSTHDRRGNGRGCRCMGPHDLFVSGCR